MKSMFAISFSILSLVALGACSKNPTVQPYQSQRAHTQDPSALAANPNPTADQGQKNSHQNRGNFQPGLIIDDRDVTKLPHGFNIMVTDNTKINQLVNAPWESAYIQSGHIFDLKDIDHSADFCLMTLGNANGVKSGQKISIAKPIVDQHTLVYVDQATGFKFACDRYSDDSVWTVQEVKTAFSNTASILVSDRVRAR